MSDADYTNDPEAVIEQAAAHKAEADAKHETLLEAARQGEEALLTEEVVTSIGEADITVRTDLTGSVARRVDPFLKGELPPGEMIDVMAEVLAEQTKRVEANGVVLEDSAQIEGFYRSFIDGNDVQSASVLCFERVIEEPCEIERESFEEAVQSFPEQARGGSPGGAR